MYERGKHSRLDLKQCNYEEKFKHFHIRKAMQKNAYISVQFSFSAMSDSLPPHGLQQARLPCSSPLQELTETQVHQVSDARPPSHSVSPSPVFNLSQHQSLFQ